MRILNILFFSMFLIYVSHVQAKTIMALSVDGGGIRGLIAAIVLEHIEKRLNKPLAKVFDVMVGTSTGGIIVLLLNVPNQKGMPKYNASDIVKIYKELGNTIFKQDLWHYIKTFNGWIGTKYNEENLEKFLKNYFSEFRMADTISNVVIPAFNLVNVEAEFFSTVRARISPEKNFYLRDMARATSAAPTYFPPYKLKKIENGKLVHSTLIDGGIVINNPTVSAYIESINIYKQNTDFFIVSIGTGDPQQINNKDVIPYEEVQSSGKLGWVSYLIDMIMDGASHLVNRQIPLFFPNSDKKSYSSCPKVHPNYIRLQIPLKAKDASMDNTSPENIIKLQEYAQKLIKNSKEEIDCIIKILQENE